MAASTFTCTNLLPQINKTPTFQSANRNGECSFLARRNDQLTPTTRKKGSKRDSFVVNATPEAAAAGDLLSSFSLPEIPGFSIADNPWLAVIAGLTVGLPFLIQKLVTLTKEIDMAAQTVEKIADTVGKVADEVDKAAESMVASMPEGRLKSAVKAIEHLAEETSKDAQKVEDLMDKVEELDDKLEEFLDKQTKGADKA